MAQKFPDGSYEVVIDGQHLKAVTNAQLNEQARSFDKLRAQVDSLTAQLQAADRQIAEQAAIVKDLNEKVAVKEQERDEARTNLADAKGLIAQQRSTLDQEIAFRHESVQMIPKGNSHGFWAHVLDALNSQEGQLTFKVGLQTLQTYKSFTRCP